MTHHYEYRRTHEPWPAGVSSDGPNWQSVAELPQLTNLYVNARFVTDIPEAIKAMPQLLGIKHPSSPLCTATRICQSWPRGRRPSAR